MGSDELRRPPSRSPPRRVHGRHRPSRSDSLALVQLLILYHLVWARVDQVTSGRSSGRAPLEDGDVSGLLHVPTRLMAVTVTQLVAFLTVARRGSVTAAAEELVVTQPTVSAAINALQRARRHAHRAQRPQPAADRGRRPTCRTRAIARSARAGRPGAVEARDLAPTLRVAAVTSAGEYLAPLLLRCSARPTRSSSSRSRRQPRGRLPRLADHEVDVAITGRVPARARADGGVRAERVRARHRARRPARRGAGRWRWRSCRAALAGPRARIGTRTHCARIPRRARACAGDLTLGSNGAIKQAAPLGLGVASFTVRCQPSSSELESSGGWLGAITCIRGGLRRERAGSSSRAASTPPRGSRAPARLDRSSRRTRSPAATADPLATA